MFLGAVLGLAFQSGIARQRSGTPPWYILIALAGLAIAFAVDGLNSYLHLFQSAPTLYEPHNRLRLITGTGMGLVIAAVLFPTFNQTVWSNSDQRPALSGLRPFLGLVALGLLLDLLVLTENWVILYPLALISSAGVVVLLVMIYSMILIMVFRMENRYQKLRQLTFPLAGGFTLALLQIALFNLVRFYLTGTWDGFQIG